MSRRLAIVLGVLVFLVISALVARFLTTEGEERVALLSLVRAEAKGDVKGTIAKIDGCAASPSCVTQVTRAVALTKRPGSVKILNLMSPTAYALGDATGRTRLAWAVIDDTLPVVQCVTVKRTGNALTGHDISIERLSLPIVSDGTC